MVLLCGYQSKRVEGSLLAKSLKNSLGGRESVVVSEKRRLRLEKEEGREK